MKKTVVFREMRDPKTGRVKLWAFQIEVRTKADLFQACARIDDLYPRRERLNA